MNKTNLISFFKTNKHSDFTILIEDNIYYLHRIVLSCAFPYWDKELSNVKFRAYVLENDDGFMDAIGYAYGIEIKPTHQFSFNVCVLLDKFGRNDLIKPIYEHIRDWLKKSHKVHTDTLFRVLENFIRINLTFIHEHFKDQLMYDPKTKYTSYFILQALLDSCKDVELIKSNKIIYGFLRACHDEFVIIDEYYNHVNEFTQFYIKHLSS